MSKLRPPADEPRVLVIGYGNDLRIDALDPPHSPRRLHR